MNITKINEGLGFIPARETLYNRLAELAKINVKTESERIEEQLKSREFWEWGYVECSLFKLEHISIESENATPIQNRIFRMARENRLQRMGGAVCGH